MWNLKIFQRVPYIIPAFGARFQHIREYLHHLSATITSHVSLALHACAAHLSRGARPLHALDQHDLATLARRAHVYHALIPRTAKPQLQRALAQQERPVHQYVDVVQQRPGIFALKQLFVLVSGVAPYVQPARVRCPAQLQARFALLERLAAGQRYAIQQRLASMSPTISSVSRSVPPSGACDSGLWQPGQPCDSPAQTPPA